FLPPYIGTLSRAGLAWRKYLRRRRLTGFLEGKGKKGGGSQCQDFLLICVFAEEFENPDLTRREDWREDCGFEKEMGGFLPKRGRRLPLSVAVGILWIPAVLFGAQHVPPSIVTQPIGAAVPAGQDAMFFVVASGSSTLSYQWRFNGTDIPGA